jgi:hypothetical protein
MAFRAVVMIGCLFVLPAIALLGTSLPKLVTQIWKQQFGIDSTAAASTLPEAPAYQPAAEARPAATAADPAADGDAACLGSAAPPNGQLDPAVLPAGYNAPVDQPAASGIDRFTALQQRLRQLGVIRYNLETWGNAGRMYRFHCEALIDGRADFTQFFEATATEPLAAMSKALEQVELWRAGGSASDLSQGAGSR